MPVLHYVCPACGKKFEELVKKYDDPLVSPACGPAAAREWSGEMFSATGNPVKKCTGNCKTCGGCKEKTEKIPGIRPGFFVPARKNSTVTDRFTNRLRGAYYI